MKKWPIVVYIIIIIASLGLSGYEVFIAHDYDTNAMIRIGLIFAGAVLGLVRQITSSRRQVSNKKALYQKAYSEFIENAFYDEPKLEKRFYNAIHDYNQSKSTAAVSKLEKLRKECNRSNDLRAVTVFIALCLDDMKLYEKAVVQYQAALSIRSNSTLYSNLGVCHQKLGNIEEARRCFEFAIQANPKNAIAHSNLSALYFRQNEYEAALEQAELAIQADGKMRQALTTAAICCGILGRTEDYEQYYRQAVANGANGNAIKSIIRNMDPEL